MYFFASLGLHFWSQTMLGAIFIQIFRVLSRFLGNRNFCGCACTPTSNTAAFHNSITGNFHGLSRSIWNKFIAAIRAPRKFRMIFYNFYYSWGQHCWWTQTNIIDSDFFVICKFLPLSFYPTAAPASQNMHVVSETSPKRWFANVNMTSDSGVTNRVYPATMTTVRHCSILEFGRGASHEAVAPGITRPLHGTGAITPYKSKMSWTLITMQCCFRCQTYCALLCRW